ncbi:DUF6233 domain-containing protein [Streptomyces sp. NPDC058290]|uniref:DUF6233 domain-containing protein n=1 Tax=Streptomyces sp. NPDC058290 TaxID=3346426 RepID=UPI0036F0A5A0
MSPSASGRGEGQRQRVPEQRLLARRLHRPHPSHTHGGSPHPGRPGPPHPIGHTFSLARPPERPHGRCGKQRSGGRAPAGSVRTGAGPKALRVHVGHCAMSSGKPLGREGARRMLAENVDACPYCSPENALGMTG